MVLSPKYSLHGKQSHKFNLIKCIMGKTLSGIHYHKDTNSLPYPLKPRHWGGLVQWNFRTLIFPGFVKHTFSLMHITMELNFSVKCIIMQLKCKWIIVHITMPSFSRSWFVPTIWGCMHESYPSCYSFLKLIQLATYDC